MRISGGDPLGEHSKPVEGRWKRYALAGLGWLVRNRKKVAGALVVLLPLVSRWVPDFPSDEILAAFRAFLGT